MGVRLKFVATLFCLATMAFALDASGASAAVLEPADSTVKISLGVDSIVVRSFKQMRKLSELPAAVSVVTFSDIKKREILSLKDFSSYIPNLYMPEFGSRLTSPIFIRGIGSKLSSPSVGLYVNDVPYFEKSAFDFNMTDIVSVEVLRGPQGSLYGRGSMGGVINVYTRMPIDYKGNTAQFSYGRYSDLMASMSHYGAISSKLGYSLAGSYNHKNGYFTNAYNNQKVDKENSGSGSFRMRYKPSQKLDLNLFASYEYNNQGGYPYALYDVATSRVSTVNYNDYSYYTRSMFSSGFSARYEAPRFVISSQTSYQYFDDKQGIDQDFSPSNNYFVVQRQKQNLLSEDFQIKSVEGKSSKYEWLVGAFGFYQGLDKTVDMEYKEDIWASMNLPGTMISYKSYLTPSYGVAVYHQSTLNDVFTKSLGLTVGLRYDYERSTIDYNFDNEIIGVRSHKADFTAGLNAQQFTPKVSVQYVAGAGRLVYGSVSRGFKAGGFNTSFVTDQDKSYSPENSWNYELGSRLNLWGSRLNLDLTLFYIDWRNQQIQQPLPDGKGMVLRNAGKSNSKGVEAVVSWQVIKALNLQASYGYTHAKFVDYVVDQRTNYSGNFLPLVPQNTLSLSADYSVKLESALVHRITFAAQYNANGKLYWNDKNSAEQGFYGTLNGKVSLFMDPVQLDFWVKNATNTNYITYFFESMGSAYAQKGRPVSFGANVYYRF